MDWQRKAITKKVVSLILSVLLALWALAMIIGFVNYNDDVDTGSIVLFGFFSAFFALIAWSNYRDLKESLKEYKSNKDNDLVETLKHLNPYKSQEEMQAAFNIEKQTPFFADEEFVITSSFFECSSKKNLFVINGILDLKIHIQKVNGAIDYVNLGILYYDGRRYDLKFNRPLGFSSEKKIQEKIKKIEFIANIIASNSENFRKYPTCRF